MLKKENFQDQELLRKQEQQQQQALIEEQEQVQQQIQEVLLTEEQRIRNKVLVCLNSDQELILDPREDFYYLQFNFVDKKETPEQTAQREKFLNFNNYEQILKDDGDWSLVVTKQVVNENGETEIRRVTESREEAKQRLDENIEELAEKVRKDIKNSNSLLEVNEIEVDFIDNMEELAQYYRSKWMTLFTGRHFTPLNSLITKNYRGAQDRLNTLKEKLFDKGWKLCGLNSPNPLSELQIAKLAENGYNPFLSWEKGTFKEFDPFSFTFDQVILLTISNYRARDLDSFKYRGKDAFKKSKSDWDEFLDSQPENPALNFRDDQEDTSQNDLSSFRDNIILEINEELRQYLQIENSELDRRFQNWEDHINNNLTTKREINAFKNQVINNGRKKKKWKEKREENITKLKKLLAEAEEAAANENPSTLSSKLRDINGEFFFTLFYRDQIARVENLKNKLIDLDRYSFRCFVEDVSKHKLLLKAGWIRKIELDNEMQIKYDSLKDKNLDLSQLIIIEQELEKHIGEKWAEKEINFLQNNTNEVLQSQDSLKVVDMKKRVDEFLNECEDNIYWLAHKPIAEKLLDSLNDFNPQRNDVENVVGLGINPHKLENEDNDNEQKPKIDDNQIQDVNTEEGKQLPKKVIISLVLVMFACLVTAFQFISKEKKILSTNPFQQKRMRK